MRKLEILVNRLTIYVKALEDMNLYDEDWLKVKEACEKGDKKIIESWIWFSFTSKRDVIVNKIEEISHEFEEIINSLSKSYVYMTLEHEMYMSLIMRYTSVMDLFPSCYLKIGEVRNGKFK